ncbi:MAG TPA: hypothetical protein VLN49_13070 [Gemmatimonadaceae bacterium]|nr:hypothetical protein [Gemmatimonadaceae bacterium]
MNAHIRTRWAPRIAGLVAGALVATIVLVAVRIGTRARPAAGVEMPRPAQQGAASAPDISSMTPRERATRLYDRIMRLHEERKADSVAFFAPMALGSYAEIQNMDQDSRYDMARVAMIAGELAVARAQADTILRRDPTHLLGLLLSADLARSNDDEAAAKKSEAAFVAAAARERARKLPEYQAHAVEIDDALRRLGGSAAP